MAADDKLTPHYPVFLDLKGRLVIIVGGAEQAERKATALLRYGADICVISPEPSRRLREMEAEGLITIEVREYQSSDLSGAALAIGAGVSDEIGTAVSRDAGARGCPVNVAGDAELCSFLIPSSVRRGPLQFAVSTRGAAPEVAKRIRHELQERYGQEWGTYVLLLGEVRALAADRIEDTGQRQRTLDSIAEADLIERISAGEHLDAEMLITEFMADPTPADEATEEGEATEAEAPGIEGAPESRVVAGDDRGSDSPPAEPEE